MQTKIRLVLVVIFICFAMVSTSSAQTPNRIAKFDNLGFPTQDSPLFDNGGNVGIGTTIGTYTITATKDGYQPFTAQVEVLDKGITTFNIAMTAV